MSALTIYNQAGKVTAPTTSDFNAIAATLGKLGVQFERWQANQPLVADADQVTVLSAYQESVDRLNKQFGFRSVDVVSLGPDHPKKDELRQKFLSEHATPILKSVFLWMAAACFICMLPIRCIWCCARRVI